MPWGARSRLSWFGSVGGAALIAAACAQILDTEGIVLKGTGDQPAPPPPPPTVACQPQDLKCVGTALQVCRDDQSGFRTARVCSTPELCCTDPGACPQPGCQAPACASGDFHCTGATLQICNDGQTGWTAIATCASSTQCNASLGRCTDQPCSTVGPDLQCNGGHLYGCAGSDWSELGMCATEGLCSPNGADGVCKPNGCQVGSTSPGPFSCENADLLRCNDAQTGFDLVETCLNAAHCNGLIEVTGPEVSLGLTDLRRLGCSPAACSPGHYACDGSRLALCNQNRTAYVPVQDCGSPGKCNTSTGQCDAVDCSRGTRQCSGSELQACTDAHTWEKVDDCASAALCDPVVGCKPPTCTSSDYHCNGATLERCNVNGDGWIAIHDCASEELCDAPAKRCEPPVCDTDQRRCSRDGQLQLCGPGRDAWIKQRDCRLEANLPPTASPEQISGVCDLTGTGQCQNPPACPNGALRCNTQFLERCQNAAWQPLARCATASLCDATGTGTCHDPACSPGSYQCVIPGSTPLVADTDDSKRGLTLQECNSAGRAYVTVRDCPSDNYCDAAHGQCDICDPLGLFCFDGDLYRCSADGQERELEKRCRSGCQDPESDAGVPPSGTTATGQSTCTEDLLHD